MVLIFGFRFGNNWFGLGTWHNWFGLGIHIEYFCFGVGIDGSDLLLLTYAFLCYGLGFIFTFWVGKDGFGISL